MTDEDGYITCPVCDGVGIGMGQLGNLFWYRCQDCGTEFSIKIEGSEHAQQID